LYDTEINKNTVFARAMLIVLDFSLAKEVTLIRQDVDNIILLTFDFE
jgi:hypothetical protein